MALLFRECNCRVKEEREKRERERERSIYIGRSASSKHRVKKVKAHVEVCVSA